MLADTEGPIAFTNLSEARRYRTLNVAKGSVVFSWTNNPKFYITLDVASIPRMRSDMCLCEMVEGNTSRPFLDIDSDIEEGIPNIELCIKEYIATTYKITTAIKIRWVYRGQKYYRRWHCIVSGVCFETCWQLANKDLALHVMNSLPGIVMDLGVYRDNATLRCLNQGKMEGGKCCKVLLPFESCNVNEMLITPTSDDVKITNHAGCSKNYKEQNFERSSILVDSKICTAITYGKLIPDYYNMGHNISSGPLYDKFKLLRNKVAMCKICEVVHDKENGYINIYKDKIEIGCFRSQAHKKREVLICYRIG